MGVFNFDLGGGAAPVAAAAPAGGAAAAAAPAVEEKKEEPKEESDDDMGFSLFDWGDPGPAISKFTYAVQDYLMFMSLGFCYKYPNFWVFEMWCYGYVLNLKPSY